MLKQPNEVEITGNVTCPRCHDNLTWHYLVPQRISDGNLCAVSCPTDTILASRKYSQSENDYTYTIRCPKCDTKITFKNE